MGKSKPKRVSSYDPKTQYGKRGSEVDPQQINFGKYRSTIYRRSGIANSSWDFRMYLAEEKRNYRKSLGTTDIRQAKWASSDIPATEVKWDVDLGGIRGMADAGVVRGARCLGERALQVAQPPSEPPLEGQPGAAGSDPLELRAQRSDSWKSETALMRIVLLAVLAEV